MKRITVDGFFRFAELCRISGVHTDLRDDFDRFSDDGGFGISGRSLFGSGSLFGGSGFNGSGLFGGSSFDGGVLGNDDGFIGDGGFIRGFFHNGLNNLLFEKNDLQSDDAVPVNIEGV